MSPVISLYSVCRAILALLVITKTKPPVYLYPGGLLLRDCSWRCAKNIYPEGAAREVAAFIHSMRMVLCRAAAIMYSVVAPRCACPTVDKQRVWHAHHHHK